MNAKLIGFFSGFPTHHFTDDIAEVLKNELVVRNSLVFISAWPEKHEQNDDDSNGMHKMFAERDMGFARHAVIDDRTNKSEALNLIREASCIFLMGGHATNQMRMINEKGLAENIRESRGVILGVSAGSINMGKRSVDIWESLTPYDGLGLADITIKSHYTEGETFIEQLREVSMHFPIIAMEDESAIFIKKDSIMQIGRMHWIVNGEIMPQKKRKSKGGAPSFWKHNPATWQP